MAISKENGRKRPGKRIDSLEQLNFGSLADPRSFLTQLLFEYENFSLKQDYGITREESLRWTATLFREEIPQGILPDGTMSRFSSIEEFDTYLIVRILAHRKMLIEHAQQK